MKITDDMVERAAKAVFVLRCTNTQPERTWDEIARMPQHHPTLTFYRENARTALKAALRHSESE